MKKKKQHKENAGEKDGKMQKKGEKGKRKTPGTKRVKYSKKSIMNNTVR